MLAFLRIFKTEWHVLNVGKEPYCEIAQFCVRSLSHREDTMLLISVEIKTKFQLLPKIISAYCTIHSVPVPVPGTAPAPVLFILHTESSKLNTTHLFTCLKKFQFTLLTFKSWVGTEYGDDKIKLDICSFCNTIIIFF